MSTFQIPDKVMFTRTGLLMLVSRQDLFSMLDKDCVDSCEHGAPARSELVQIRAVKLRQWVEVIRFSAD